MANLRVAEHDRVPGRHGTVYTLHSPRKACRSARITLWAAAILIAALTHSARIAEARAAFARFDPRQADVLKTSQFGPKLTGMIGEAMTLADLNTPTN